MRFDKLEMFNMFEPSGVITVIMAFQYLVSISREMSETPPTFHLFLHQASGPVPVVAKARDARGTQQQTDELMEALEGQQQQPQRLIQGTVGTGM